MQASRTALADRSEAAGEHRDHRDGQRGDNSGAASGPTGPGSVKRAVVDASVAVKWVVEEEFSDAAERLLTMGTTLHAPSHWLAEVLNTITAYCVFKRRITADAAWEKATFIVNH